jgi:hypothetical protein
MVRAALVMNAILVCIVGCGSLPPQEGSGSVESELAIPAAMPNPGQTPGALCTRDDPDFDKLDYPEHIARCQRNIGTAEKRAVAAAYGNIPQSEWHNYEFDHFIPLSIGGSNSPENLWPQPLDEARDKDRVELQAYNELKAGTITQVQAIALIRAWRPSGHAASPCEECARVIDEDDD